MQILQDSETGLKTVPKSWIFLMAYVSKLHNKLFKSDSQRVAFLLCVAFSG
ncbi:hypothetical protein [Vibrio vulnificus YJ016]|uniref:Uncharacterized protein n=1 Tax=Vibrio vulnificus (strain YJ016) TaxID=196600 RepID=Q7MK83_VIBVY|nr:hypothetical protein [Vibrio vulnificus YJ016]